MKLKRFFLYGFSKSFLLKIILALLILLMGKNVFAASVTSKVEAIPDFGGGTYTGYTPASVPVPSYFNINTRYNGKLSIIEFYLDADNWNWNYNKTYTITLNMASEDWRNNFMGPQVFQAQSNGNTTGSNLYVSGSFKYVSYKTIKFNFKIGSSMSPYLKFRLYSTNTGTTGITGTNNWNLSSIDISAVTSSTPTPIPVTPTPRPATPTPQPNNQDIINNATQNTQDIINNQNSNTNSIIDNQNTNTNDIIDNQTQNSADIIDNANANTQNIIDNNNENTTCPVGPLVLSYSEWSKIQGFYLNATGTQIFGNGYGISPFLSIKPNTEYTIITNGGTMPTNVFYCLYTNQDSVQSCYNYDSSGTTTFTTSNHHKYLRVSLLKARTVSVKGPVCNNWEKESQDETNKKLDELNNNITSESTPDIDLDIDINPNSPVSGLLTMPLTLLNKVFDLSDDTCQPYVLPFDFSGGNNTLTLPCIDLHDYLGNDVYNILDTILCFYFAYEIGMMCVSIYEGITGLNDSFGMLYEPKHGPDSYQPKHGGDD